jgi:hypothetical protein
MKFDDAMKKVARRAERATKRSMEKLSAGRIKHEDDLTPALVQAIEDGVNQYQVGGVSWDASILTHRRSGEEGVFGADILIHVSLDTPQYKYSKGVLIQAKRTGPGQNLKTAQFEKLVGQCNTMLSWTPASFVFSYDSRGLRAASATKIAGAADKALYDQCNWTAYRFFLELFRCPIGDPHITSADIEQFARYGVAIKGKGDLDSDRFDESEA